MEVQYHIQRIGEKSLSEKHWLGHGSFVFDPNNPETLKNGLLGLDIKVGQIATCNCDLFPPPGTYKKTIENCQRLLPTGYKLLQSGVILTLERPA